jgi:hypothetical protein
MQDQDLQQALELFKSEYGEIDNIKLLLGEGTMDDASVGADLLRIAKGIKSGEFAIQADFPEANLAKTKISL